MSGSGGGGYLGPRAAVNSARAAEIALQQNEAWNNFRVQDERLKRETQQVSLQGIPGVGPTNLGRAQAAAQGAEFHMGAPGTELSPKDAIGSLASGRMAANFMQNAYDQFAAESGSLPVPASSDPLRRYRFVTNEEAHEASLRSAAKDGFVTNTMMGSVAHTHNYPPDEDDDFGMMSARQKKVLADIEKRNEEMTDDLFDDGPNSYARFFKRNLAGTAVFLLVLSLLVYTSLDPVASDFILKLSLSSPLNERLSSREAHTLHMVDSEQLKVRGVWWRVESLEGSGKPSTYHNQWDLAGVLFFSDDACKVPIPLGSSKDSGGGEFGRRQRTAVVGVDAPRVAQTTEDATGLGISGKNWGSVHQRTPERRVARQRSHHGTERREHAAMRRHRVVLSRRSGSGSGSGGGRSDGGRR